MKSIRTAVLLALAIIFLSVSCKKGNNKNPVVKTPDTSELAKLPPATQTGAHTFACLVNGKAFIAPGGNVANLSGIQCSYTHNATVGYSFLVAGFDNVGDTSKSVIINTDSLQIAQGQTFKLNLFGKGNASGIYSTFFNATPLTEYDTGGAATGALTITRLDSTAKIVSGTFWFDAVNSSGDTVHIRSGRFDVDVTYKN